MKKKILFSLLAALILPCMAMAQMRLVPKVVGGKKSSVKSIMILEDEFTGSRIYQSNDSQAFELEGGDYLTLYIVPSISICDVDSSIMLSIAYQIGTKEDTVFEKIVFIGGGKKVAVELDSLKITNAVTKIDVRPLFIDVHVHKCIGTISKEEYDLLKEIFASSGDVKFAAYSTTNTMTPTSQGKLKGKKYKTLFSDLETATLADNPDVTFANGDGVIKISAQ
ncbi:MAG: hypothetical protein K2I95_03015 [Treponemataceae bacterium]|nr:hypothetical protein [Treponemataceae bacterium]